MKEYYYLSAASITILILAMFLILALVKIRSLKSEYSKIREETYKLKAQKYESNKLSCVRATRIDSLEEELNRAQHLLETLHGQITHSDADLEEALSNNEELLKQINSSKCQVENLTSKLASANKNGDKLHSVAVELADYIKVLVKARLNNARSYTEVSNIVNEMSEIVRAISSEKFNLSIIMFGSRISISGELKKIKKVNPSRIEEILREASNIVFVY